jgi:hypothetical protein
MLLTLTCISTMHTVCTLEFPFQQWLRKRATILRHWCSNFLVILLDEMNSDDIESRLRKKRGYNHIYQAQSPHDMTS